MSDKKIPVDYYKEMICLLDSSVDDYLFIHDFRKHICFLSPHIVERFRLDSYYFDHAEEVFKQVVYKKDLKAFLEDMAELAMGIKESHDMTYRWLSKDNDIIWINCRGRALYDENHMPEYLIGCINEIGKKQEADNVSGLLGQISFKKEIERENHKDGFVVRFGIDDFKMINENYGVSFGDGILKDIASILKQIIDEKQKIYRIVGDEFLLYDSHGNKDDAIKIVNLFQESIERYIAKMDYEFYFTVSAGIVELSHIENSNYESVMKYTEFSLSEAKNQGKNMYIVFEQKDYEAKQRDTCLIKELRRAVVNDFQGFELHYQPIIDASNEKLTSLEALLRFHCQTFGSISPMEFIPLLEKSGLIIPVGKWVLEESLKTLEYLKKYSTTLKMHVNISYIQVLKSNILKDLLHILSQYDVENSQLVIELTESGFVATDSKYLDLCHELRKHHIQLALDDFGTGYSNFQYLYDMKPDYLKIDRGIMKKAMKEEYNHLLLKQMVEMAHSVNEKICIEGIETKGELFEIMKLHTDYIQGFYYSRPCPLDEIEKKIINLEMKI